MVLFSIPPFALGIVQLIFHATVHSGCDGKSNWVLSIKDWLLGDGVINLVLGCLWLLSFLLTERFRAGCCSLLCMLFGPAGIVGTKIVKAVWLIIGFVVLFRGDMECIEDGEAKAICMLVSFAFDAWMLYAYSGTLPIGGFMLRI